jgi:hypothetical protein
MSDTVEAEPEHKERENTIVPAVQKTHVFSLILFVCLIAFIVFVRLRILGTPLERDEGEYAYMGQLLLQGVPPYLEAFNMKLPGTSMMYAFFMLLFGQTSAAIHLGLLLVNIGSMFLIYFLAKKWLDTPAAVVSSSSFGLLSLSPSLLGFAAHATHFVVFFALGGILVLLHALEKKNRFGIFLSGALFGCAFLMKQPGIFFFFFGISLLGIYGMNERLSMKNICRYGLSLLGGLVVPLALILLVVYIGGAFHNFWFWVVQYAVSYNSVLPFGRGMTNLGRILSLFWNVFPLFCVLIAAGFALTITGKFSGAAKSAILLFGLFSCLAVVPGLYFRDHYFILVLPACCIAIGSGFQTARHYLEQRPLIKYLPALLLSAVFCGNIVANDVYYFSLSSVDIVRYFYGINYFAEAIPVSNYLVRHTAPDERIALIGSEPEVFFYTHRRSVSGYIYMYGMMEPQPFARRMQEEFIADVERSRPGHIVCFWTPYTWLVEPNSDRRIFEWSKQYLEKNYFPVGIIDLIDINTVRYVWGKDARGYKPVSKTNIYIYQRTEADSVRAN